MKKKKVRIGVTLYNNSTCMDHRAPGSISPTVSGKVAFCHSTFLIWLGLLDKFVFCVYDRDNELQSQAPRKMTFARGNSVLLGWPRHFILCLWA